MSDCEVINNVNWFKSKGVLNKSNALTCCLHSTSLTEPLMSDFLRVQLFNQIVATTRESSKLHITIFRTKSRFEELATLNKINAAIRLRILLSVPLIILALKKHFLALNTSARIS